jgi:hypothetical protein
MCPNPDWQWRSPSGAATGKIGEGSALSKFQISKAILLPRISSRKRGGRVCVPAAPADEAPPCSRTFVDDCTGTSGIMSWSAMMVLSMEYSRQGAGRNGHERCKPRRADTAR